VYITYLIVTILAAAMNTFSAAADFLRVKQVYVQMKKAGVPDSWLNPLAILKAAGAIGLLVGMALPLVGIAAATGLVLFFTGAIVTHLRAGYDNIAFPIAYLLPAAASLVLGYYLL
jgi:multisubunit Na+/H+ antiporter MnhG subunit